jgi:hypothetical protein
LEELQERYKRNELCKFYEGIREIREGFQPRTSMCKSKQGLIIGDEEKILEVWAEYFYELLNPQFNGITPEEKTYFGPEWDIKPPTIQDVSRAIRNMKNNTTPGEDLIMAELLKHGGSTLQRIHHLTVD